MNKKSLILFVGNVDISLRDAAKQYNPTAELIKSNNLSTLDQLTVGYVSIGDHTVDDFVTILDQATEIYYVPSIRWHSDNTQKQTEFYLRLASHRIPVYNIDKIPSNPMLYLADSRKTEGSQLWAVGCSYTVGIGVEKHQTYGAVISNKLNLPLSILAESGTSVSWAADQILRSDIRKDDIVVWGLTGMSRFPFYQDGQVAHVLPNFYQRFPKFNQIINEEILVSDHILYTAITSIQQVVEHSRNIGYKLVVTQFPLNAGEHELHMLHYLSQFKFFVHSYKNADNPLIDCGTDKTHPGPLQHQHYANIILENLSNENLS